MFRFSKVLVLTALAVLVSVNALADDGFYFENLYASGETREASGNVQEWQGPFDCRTNRTDFLHDGAVAEFDCSPSFDWNPPKFDLNSTLKLGLFGQVLATCTGPTTQQLQCAIKIDPPQSPQPPAQGLPARHGCGPYETPSEGDGGYGCIPVNGSGG